MQKTDNNLKTVLVLFSFKKNKIADYEDVIRKLNERAPEYGYKVVRGATKELEFSIIDNKPSVFETLTGQDLANFDLVFYRMWQKEFERATSAAIYLKSKGVPFFDEDVYNYRAFSKLTETFLMVTSGVPVPNSYFSTAKNTIKSFKENPPIDFPLIVKNIRGLKGKDNYLVHSNEELEKVLENNSEIDFVVQEFIPNNCDYRFLVLGDKVKLIIKRSRLDDSSHLNNTSQGAGAELVPIENFDKQIINDVLKASKVMKRDFTGVDVIINKETGKHYLLEVNNVPEIISVFIEEKVTSIHEYIAERLKNEK